MRALGVVLSLAVISIVVWPQDDIRWRMTLQINTPHGVRSASGIWSLRVGDWRYHPKFLGEAIPLDLPNGRTVFALLEMGGPNQEPEGSAAMLIQHALWRRFGYPRLTDDSRAKQVDYLKSHYRNVVLKLDCEPELRMAAGSCPLLVSFPDPKNPGTIVALDPNNLAAELGPGYSLKGIYAQITDDRPSHQLGKRLPWLDGQWDRYIGMAGPAPHGSLASQLGVLSFRSWPQTHF